MKTRARAIREYHRSFRGDTYDACSRCGGRCEKYKTSTLVPGEKRYIAAHLGIPVKELERVCLDRLDTPYGTVDVIRLDSACPFLGKDERCSIVQAKPVLCDCYPIVIVSSRGKPRFGIDRRGCPMARSRPYRSCIRRFVDRGIPALARLRLDAKWRKMVALYDEFDYDCEEIRRGLERKSLRRSVAVEELLAFARADGGRKARSRGLALLKIRLGAAVERELAVLSALTGRRVALRSEARACAGSLRSKSLAARRELAAARRDGALLGEPRARRYLRIVRNTMGTIDEIGRDGRRFARRLERLRRLSVPSR